MACQKSPPLACFLRHSINIVGLDAPGSTAQVGRRTTALQAHHLRNWTAEEPGGDCRDGTEGHYPDQLRKAPDSVEIT